MLQVLFVWFEKLISVVSETNRNLSVWYFKNGYIVAWGHIHGRWQEELPTSTYYDDVIKWKHFPHYWSLVRGIHRSPVNSPHKDQWRGAWIFSLIYVRINSWVNNREAGDLRRHCTHYDVSLIGNPLHKGFMSSWTKSWKIILLWAVMFRLGHSFAHVRIAELSGTNKIVTWIDHQSTKYNARILTRFQT